MIGTAHACNSNTREAGTGESQTLANSVSHDQILSSCSPSMKRCSQGGSRAKGHAQLHSEYKASQ